MSKFDPSKIQKTLAERLPQYTRIKDCIAGSDAIKAKTTNYLPMPDATNDSDENLQRYKDYVERAVFYNITEKTVSGLVGIAFNRDIPVLEVPETLDYLLSNIDGAGITLEQQIKKTTSETISLGRCGLFVDYSKDKAETQQDIIDGKVRGAILLYEAPDIVWVETTTKDVEVVLSLIVLRETYSEPSGDGYTNTSDTQYRVLTLKEGYYTQETWRQINDTKEWTMYGEAQVPTDNSGKTFDYIPFTFVGSLNNDASFDESPILTIADLNIAHYRNSADAEESSFVHGQATLVMTGLTKNWVDTVLKGTVRMGTRGGIPLPKDADAKLLQISENSLPVKGMNDKEKQMSAIGARLVTDTTGNKTATEVNRDSNNEDSELSNIVGNVEQAYKFCFEQLALFSGITGFDISLLKDFSTAVFNPQVYVSLVNGAMQGVGQKEDIFNYLKNTDMVAQELTYNEWLTNIENEIPSFDGITTEDETDITEE